MAARKTERLLNLVICLLNTGRPVTAAQIRTAVPGYPDSDEAFARMFERDKAELRELGIPVALEGLSEWDDEFGYRIRPGDYALPEIHLEPDEASALALAARVWQQASLAEAASGALLKLRAAGVDTADATLAGIEPLVTAQEPAFEPMWAAVHERRPVTFDYRTGQATAPTSRHLEPWGIVSWHGRWYVPGHDRDRDDVRVFRLDRVVGDVTLTGAAGEVVVPEGVNLRAIVTGEGDGGDEPTHTARIRVRAGTCVGLRRRATVTAVTDEQGYDAVDLAYRQIEQLAEELAGCGADVVVLDPPEVRAAVLRRLRAAAGATK